MKGRLGILRRRRGARAAGLVAYAWGALALPALHVLEHAREAEGAAARVAPPSGHRARVRRLIAETLHADLTPHAHAPGTAAHVHLAHRHAPDGSRVPTPGGAPDAGHGRGAFAHFGGHLLPAGVFLPPPPFCPLADQPGPRLRSRIVLPSRFVTRSPRGPPPATSPVV